MRVWVFLLIVSIFAFGNARKTNVPPQPVFHGHFRSERQRMKVADKVAHWSRKDKTNPWELGGLYQGDIMKRDRLNTRSGMENLGARWPGGIVPYFIQRGFFNGHQVRIIMSAINEYHKHTCIRFRPFKRGDSSYLVIKGQKGGCWSYIGRINNRRQPGQQVNLQPPGCVHRGVVIHELMHAIGFHHQQSSANRDQYVKIIWQNVIPAQKHNFDKRKTLTFNVGYDYNSIMHYSAYAMSRNKQPTIVPKDRRAKIGQRNGLSQKDILKIRRMYGCKNRKGRWASYKK